MSELKWPEKPICHNISPAFRLADCLEWRKPRIDRKYGRIETYRTCSYCGSIHPEDLYTHLRDWNLNRSTLEKLISHSEKQMLPLGGTDWKYGWPHKFYVYGITNPLAGTECEVGSDSYPIYSCCGEEFSGKEHSTCPKCSQNRFNCRIIKTERRPIIGKASAFAWVKFYNEHLLDLEEDAFSALTNLISEYGKIKFGKNAEGVLTYSAPRYGYQV